ncbi:MAG: hypothetical protein ACREDU_10270 [Methylocella sp.]
MITGVVISPGNRLEALKGDRKGQHSIRSIASPWLKRVIDTITRSLTAR